MQSTFARVIKWQKCVEREGARKRDLSKKQSNQNEFNSTDVTEYKVKSILIHFRCSQELSRSDKTE